MRTAVRKLILPVLLILNRSCGIVGIEVAQPIADILTAATSIPFVLYYFRHLPPETAPPNE